MTVKLIYDSVYTRVQNIPLDTLQKILQSGILTYTDKSKLYANRRNAYNWENPDIVLYEEDKFYTGLLPYFTSALKNNKVDYDVDRRVELVDPVKVEYTDEDLWPHQQKLLKTALESVRCVLGSPTGSGKTRTIAWYIKHFPDVPILVVTPDADIMENNAATIEKVIGEPVARVNAKSKVLKRVTVGVINSLYKLVQKDSRILNIFKILIIDECHMCGNTKMYTTVCNSLTNTYRRLGLSATPKRENGDTKVMEGLIGPIVLTISPEELIKANVIVPPHYCVIQIPDGRHRYKDYDKTLDNYRTLTGKPERPEVYRKEIVNNDYRNNIIIKIIKHYESKAKRPWLCLTEIIEHGQYLSKKLDRIFVEGATTNKERQIIIERLNNCKEKGVVASSVFNVGTDIPSLGLIIIAGGGSASNRLIQQVGRSIRKYKGKSHCIVVDFKDLERYYLFTNYINRANAFDESYPGLRQEYTLEALKDKISNECD